MSQSWEFLFFPHKETIAVMRSAYNFMYSLKLYISITIEDLSLMLNVLPWIVMCVTTFYIDYSILPLLRLIRAEIGPGSPEPETQFM